MNKYIQCSYSLFARCSFDNNENKLDYYTEKEKEHVLKTTNFEKLKTLL